MIRDKQEAIKFYLSEITEENDETSASAVTKRESAKALVSNLNAIEESQSGDEPAPDTVTTAEEIETMSSNQPEEAAHEDELAENESPLNELPPVVINPEEAVLPDGDDVKPHDLVNIVDSESNEANEANNEMLAIEKLSISTAKSSIKTNEGLLINF